MFKKFLFLEIKSFFRSPQFGASLAMKILMFFAYTYFAVLFVGGAFLLYYGAHKEKLDPLKLFTQFFLLYWVADLVIKYTAQSLPANNIKPLLTMDISKNSIAGYTLAKILVSFFTWAYLLFIIPFTILLLRDGSYSNSGILGLACSTVLLIFTNAFVNILINKNNFFLYTVFAIIFSFGALYYFKIINVLQISETIFYGIYLHPPYFVLVLLALSVIGFFTFKFIKENLYLDKGLELKKSVGKTENIAFLNKYGAIGTFINNDIKLIKRSKAARGAAVGSLFFLFYGLFFTSTKNILPIFPGIFITGGFMLMFGQRVPSWDSSYYPLMMTQNVPYKEYLKAKWWLIIIAIAVSMILALAYAFFMGWEYYFTIFAAGLYNLGVNSYLVLIAGAYNKKPIDLNSASKGFAGGGQNNFNLKILLLLIPQLVIPIIVFLPIQHFFGLLPAVLIIGALGLVGFLLRDRIFNYIVKIYKTEKYTTLAAFKKVDD